MNTYGHLVYMVTDLAKSISDDSSINENHILFLLDKYRTYLLKQKYNKEVKNIPIANYQTICLDLSLVQFAPSCKDSCLIDTNTDKYLKSTIVVPNTLDIGDVIVKGDNIFNSTISMITPYRMEFVGNNKWLYNTIYGTINTDRYLYLKSSNPILYKTTTTGGTTTLDFNRVHMTAIFEDSRQAGDLYCCNNDQSCVIENCDVMKREFHLEDELISQLLSLTLRDVVGGLYKPKDSTNNANDDLADIANFIRNNMKSRYNQDTLDTNAN